MGLTPVHSKTFTSSSMTTKNHTNIQTRDINTVVPPSSSFLSQTYTNLSLETQLQYSRNGHAVLRNLLSPEYIHEIKQDLISFSNHNQLQAYQQKVEVATKSSSMALSCHTVEECIHILSDSKDTTKIQLPFLQYFNTWKSIRSIYTLVTSTRLAHAAATLMDIPSIKLYQDSLFHKRYQDGPTPWHSDGRMIPLDTSHMITFWIPLDNIPHPKEGGTGLYFVDKSHSDFALPFWNGVMDYENQPEEQEKKKTTATKRHDEYQRLQQRYGGEKHSVKHYMPMNVGDVTVHSGWTLHCANGNDNPSIDRSIKTQQDGKKKVVDLVVDRYALAISYVDARAQVRDGAWEDLVVQSSTSTSSEQGIKGYNEDRWSFQEWLKDVKPRRYFEHDLVPIVWPVFSKK